MQRRSRALWPYPSRIPWIATAVGCQATLARLQTRDSQPEASSVHGIRFTTRNHRSAPVRIHNPEPRIHNLRLFSAQGLDPRPNSLSVHGFRSTTLGHTRTPSVSTTLSSPSAWRWVHDPTPREKATHHVGPRLPLRVSGKERPKTVPATNVHLPRTS